MIYKMNLINIFYYLTELVDMEGLKYVSLVNTFVNFSFN